MVATYIRNGRGKSINAYLAESQGKYPLTKATTVIYRKLKPYFNITKKDVRKWLLLLGSSEYHHVGKYATCCDYYDTEEIIDCFFENIDESDFFDKVFYENSISQI